MFLIKDLTRKKSYLLDPTWIWSICLPRLIYLYASMARNDDADRTTATFGILQYFRGTITNVAVVKIEVSCSQ